MKINGVDASKEKMQARARSTGVGPRKPRPASGCIGERAASSTTGTSCRRLRGSTAMRPSAQMLPGHNAALDIPQPGGA
jgi:hypothetical protein